jgi:hypothetical protein
MRYNDAGSCSGKKSSNRQGCVDKLSIVAGCFTSATEPGVWSCCACMHLCEPMRLSATANFNTWFDLGTGSNYSTMAHWSLIPQSVTSCFLIPSRQDHCYAIRLPIPHFLPHCDPRHAYRLLRSRTGKTYCWPRKRCDVWNPFTPKFSRRLCYAA